MESNPHLDNLIFLSIELGIPVGELEHRLTPQDYRLYRVYYKRKFAREQNQQRMQQQRMNPKGKGKGKR